MNEVIKWEKRHDKIVERYEKRLKEGKIKFYRLYSIQ